MKEIVYIGWDVGAWHCDKNKNSKDAIIVLDENASLLGNYETNLKYIINESDNVESFINNLFSACNIDKLNYDNSTIIMAIDAPLGFSEALTQLINGGCKHEVTEYNRNPYLFRETELCLFTKGMKPLSSINHMIGSQTTKAMHVVAKFTPKIERRGVWTDEKNLTIIETYPAACALADDDKNVKDDLTDAFICARMAQIFDKNYNELSEIEGEPPEKEGWIWVPKQRLDKYSEFKRDLVEMMTLKQG